MDKDRQRHYEARCEVIKALGHPSRLIMVEELNEGRRCVCELQALVGSDMSTVSKHLAILKQAGIVEVEKEGTKVFYELTMPCVMRFMGCVEAVMQEKARKQMTALG